MQDIGICTHCGGEFLIRSTERPRPRRFCSRECSDGNYRGDPPPAPRPLPLCVVDGCDQPRYNNKTGLCNTHYIRLRKHGDPLRMNRAENGVGYISHKGYRWISVDGREVQEHRWLMEQHIGRPLRADEHVHHVNGKRDDNRLENLEVLPVNVHMTKHGRLFKSETHKECSRCGQILPRDQFTRVKVKPGSLQDPSDTRCKPCNREVYRLRYAGTG